jgi:ketosteroid isomerase-like protein
MLIHMAKVPVSREQRLTGKHRLGYRGRHHAANHQQASALNLPSYTANTKCNLSCMLRSAFACLLFLVTGAASAADRVEPLNKNNFDSYIRALTEQDFDALEQYYSKDIVVKFGDLVLDHDAVMQYEKGQAAFMDSVMEVHRLVGDDHNIVIEASQVRTMLSDTPDDSVKAGTAFHSRLIVFYTLAEGKISTMEVFNLSNRQVD